MVCVRRTSEEAVDAGGFWPRCGKSELLIVRDMHDRRVWTPSGDRSIILIVINCLFHCCMYFPDSNLSLPRLHYCKKLGWTRCTSRRSAYVVALVDRASEAQFTNVHI